MHNKLFPSSSYLSVCLAITRKSFIQLILQSSMQEELFPVRINAPGFAFGEKKKKKNGAKLNLRE